MFFGTQSPKVHLLQNVHRFYMGIYACAAKSVFKAAAKSEVLTDWEPRAADGCTSVCRLEQCPSLQEKS